MRYKAPSIKEAGGLKIWLDTKKAENNSLDYDVFVTMYTQKVNPTNIARSFGKRASTVKHWIAVYLEEGGTPHE